MKVVYRVLILALAAWPCFGQSKPVAVDVYVNNRDASAQLLGSGMLLASDIFKKIGVRTNWHTGELREGQRGFGIRTAEHAPESASSEALAASQLVGASGVEITIYKDRVQRFLNDHHSLANGAVAYVLTHELAHAMQGVARHSESGILKTRWSPEDFQQMMYHKLAFTPSDVELIHQGIAVRLASRRPERTDEASTDRSVVSNLGKR